MDLLLCLVRLNNFFVQLVFTALLLIQAFVALSVQLANIGSAAIFFLTALPLFVVLALNPLFVGSNQRISLWTYGLGQFLPSLSGSLLLLGVVEVFVPLVSFIYLCTSKFFATSVLLSLVFLFWMLTFSFFFPSNRLVASALTLQRIISWLLSSQAWVRFPSLSCCHLRTSSDAASCLEASCS